METRGINTCTEWNFIGDEKVDRDTFKLKDTPLKYSEVREGFFIYDYIKKGSVWFKCRYRMEAK